LEHHYSLTGRMLARFVGGLMVLAILVFAAGLLVGREWGTTEATEGLAAAQRNRASPAPSPAPAQAPATPAAAMPSAPAASAAGSVIHPPDALPPPPAAPAVPVAPAVPALPQAPGAAATPPLPPAKTSGVRQFRETAIARLSGEASGRRAAGATTAPGWRDRDATGGSEIHGYVVYVGAFENTGKAENLVEELSRRGLHAQTSPVEKSGRKPLLAVWVGPFDTRAGAVAVLPAIREVGVDDPMIRAVP
jgi:hypothetical protein